MVAAGALFVYKKCGGAGWHPPTPHSIITLPAALGYLVARLQPIVFGPG